MKEGKYQKPAVLIFTSCIWKVDSDPLISGLEGKEFYLITEGFFLMLPGHNKAGRMKGYG